MDLVVVVWSDGGGYRLIVLEGNGDGTFASPDAQGTEEIDASLNGAEEDDDTLSASLVDVDNDGLLDVLVTRCSDISVYPGTGTLLFGSARTTATGFAACSYDDIDELGDFTGDGILDVWLVGRGSYTWDESVLMVGAADNATTTFKTNLTDYFLLQPFRRYEEYETGVAVGDLNKDGITDLVLGLTTEGEDAPSSLPQAVRLLFNP